MTLDASLAEAPPHHCRPPKIETWGDWPDDGEFGLPPLLHRIPAGTRFYCPCGKVWVVNYVPEQVGARSVVCAHYAWGEETRRQRRQRARHMRRARRDHKRRLVADAKRVYTRSHEAESDRPGD